MVENAKYIGPLLWGWVVFIERQSSGLGSKPVVLNLWVLTSSANLSLQRVFASWFIIIAKLQ